MNKASELILLKEKLNLGLNDFYNDEIRDVCLRILTLMINSNPDNKRRFKPIVLDSFKFLSEYQYVKKDFKECLCYLDKIKSLDLYKKETDSNINHVNIRYFQCESMIAIYNENLEKIKRIEEGLLKFAPNTILTSVLKDDYNKVLDMIKSYLNNSIRTRVNFVLPYKINISKEEEIIYEYNDIIFTLKFKNIVNSTNNNIPFKAVQGVLELEYDKYGVSSKSEIVITFNKFFDATHKMDDLLEFCLKAFNYFLNFYRQVTKLYWIDNLILSNVYSSSNVVVESENYNIIEIPFYYGRVLKSSRLPKFMTKEKINELSEKLKIKEDIALWNILYDDAKNYMLMEKYREALLSINSAFENYLNIKSREILSKKMTLEQVEDYLAGTLDYDNYQLRDYITQENFKKAIEDDILKPYSPSTFQIIKKCIDVGNMNINKRQVNKLVIAIRRNRNDVIHGNIVSIKNIKLQVSNSVDAFQDFIKKFN